MPKIYFGRRKVLVLWDAMYIEENAYMYMYSVILAYSGMLAYSALYANMPL